MARRRYRDCPPRATLPASTRDSLLLRACRGKTVVRPPVWLMRQAGRYMASYQAIRRDRAFLELCHDSELAAAVTLDAQRRLEVDAAIVFADILLILEGLGLPLDYVAGDGPVLGRPLRSEADLDTLAEPAAAAAACGYVADAVAGVVAGLDPSVPVIGFCGGPFTLASYAIEGGASRQFAATRRFLYHQPAAWHRLLDHLVDSLLPYAAAQVAAGAAAFQVFESWGGALTVGDWDEFVQPHLARLVAGLPEGIPVIVFAAHAGHLLERFRDAGADVIGLDASCDLVATWDRLGGSERVAVMGNLDPGLLLAPRARLLAAVDRLLEEVGDRPGWVCNLGHGVLKETDEAQARAFVERVRGVA